MKENKGVKNKNNQVEELPSKGKIIFAWILLIVLSGCTAGLVYLKNNNSLVLEQQGETVNKVSPVVTAALTDIIDKFNTGSLVTGYRDEGLELSASLKDTTITIIYTYDDFTGSMAYNYNVSGNLTASIPNTEDEAIDKIFKAMVMACRDRLEKEENILGEFDKFLNNEVELYGLKKEIINDNINYYIDIRYPGFAPEVVATSEY